MNENEHMKWKPFWDAQADVADSHEAVRGDRIMSDEVQAFHDMMLLAMFEATQADAILDAGCGTGDQIMLFSPYTREITAIDFSPKMVNRCRARIAPEEFHFRAKVSVETGDITALPFPDDTFDKAVSVAVLQYLNPKECDKALAELARVIKPGGVLLIHIKDMWSGTGMMITFGRFLRAIIKGRPPLEYQYRTHWWYKKKARKVGRVEASYAYGTWTPFMPKRMMAAIALWETKFRLFQELLPHGKEYFIKIRIN